MQASSTTLEKTELQLGFIPLTDCAPLVVAAEKGYFERRGLQVELVEETSWADIRDKVAYGVLDGAHMLAGIPIASTLGVGSLRVPMVTAFSMDLNGNGITLSNALYSRMLAASPDAASHPRGKARALRKVVDQDKAAGKPPMTFAMVFPVSSHNYQLRYWLASGGIDPDEDVRLIVAPPALMVEFLRAGRIDGYCVGEPWNAYAVQRGLGRTVVTSSEIWNNHPEKVFGVTQEWAKQHPNTHRALLSSLLEASEWLDQPRHRWEIAELLAQGRYVNAPAEVIRMSMTGTFKYAATLQPVPLPDFNVFNRYAATFPWRSHAIWFITQMYRWGQIEHAVNIREAAEAVYRPDLYREVAEALGVPYPTIDYKAEGVRPGSWVLTEASAPIAMGHDLFIDGSDYDPEYPTDYLEGFSTRRLRVSLEDLRQLNG